ncbi:DUF6140 family protein [uncultured Rikenella sp.]|uniref:DUF6140 family protein n=1 Tax=uncultured Rikenella sp. TaxID=368003 RepID=UPI00260C1701|nr:DUF6140 family protein [uncultured Rikenella sp.]
MAKTFQVTPKRRQNRNGVIITPEMTAVVTTRIHRGDPFGDGASEVREAFMRLYGVDLKKGCYSKNDFDIKVVG